MYGLIPLGKAIGPWGGVVPPNGKVKEPEKFEILAQGFFLSLLDQGRRLPVQPPAEAVSECFLSSDVF